MSNRASRAKAAELELERLRATPRAERDLCQWGPCDAAAAGYALDGSRWRAVCERHLSKARRDGYRVDR